MQRIKKSLGYVVKYDKLDIVEKIDIPSSVEINLKNRQFRQYGYIE
jgi:hypothetical protein